MLTRGDHIFLKLAEEGVYLNESELVKADKISIGLSTPRSYCPDRAPKWVKAQVYEYESGVLDCNIVNFNQQDSHKFSSQTISSDAIAKLILCGSSTHQLLRLTDISGSRPHRGRVTPDFKPREPFVMGTERRRKSSDDVPLVASRPESPKPQGFSVIEHKEEFKFRFDEMQIIEGAALFKVEFYIPRYYRPVELELRVENDFLRVEFNTIKVYLGNCLKRKTVEVSAIIRTQGAEVVSVEAEAPVVAQITADLLDDVKYRYIKRELRETEDKAGLSTVDDLFDKVKDSGLQPDDRQFIDDLLAIKAPRHAEHVQHLSAIHLYDLVKLRIQTKPFAFVFFVSGKQGCFFILETLDKKDATYLWKLNATQEEIRQNHRLAGEAIVQVEQEISLIRDHGRNPYRKDAPDNFMFVEHDNISDEGFATWKSRLQGVLDGDE